MAGLMNPGKEKGQKKPDAAMGGDTAAMGGEAMGGDDGNVSPEEQAQYDEFVSNGMNMIYDEKGLEQILAALQGDGNPVEGVANVLVSVVGRLEEGAEQSGAQLSGDVLYHGGVELLEQLVEMAEKAQIHEFSDKEMESALFMALDQYRGMRQEQGKLPEERLKADFQSILQAENDGSLEDILPGIEEYAANAPQPGQAPPQQG